MWRWAFLTFWWCSSITCAIGSPPGPSPESGPGPGGGPEVAWRCPEIAEQPIVECSCDMPHTLRCTGDRTAIGIVGRTLRSLPPASVSLLDCTVTNVTSLSSPLLEGVSLHGLVVSSGEIRDVHPVAFKKLASPLQALGLPNNKLETVPTEALAALPELDRLALSGNRMAKLDGGSFKGLRNLSFIDLSDNVISKIAPNTFSNIPQLRILRLRGNKLTIVVISKLNPLPTLEELDLSDNVLVGPVGPKTLPRMEALRDLQLSHNTLSSIKMGALQGLTNLTSLRLQHNQIDVIEDHAFINLGSLVILDLAHNRIVAVSGASLAHLTKLTDLDLRHNFLRALTPDLVQPLKSLKTVLLDDNEISIVASDALKSTTAFKHFTLSENPLNCDCSLSDFAAWLNNSTLSNEDKATAICTTPPSLENGLLIEVSPENLECGEDEQDAPMPPLAAQSSFKARINLKEFQYDGSNIKLQWGVEDETTPYTCDAIFVYEEEGQNEVLVETNPLKCNSTELVDPKVLNVTVPNISDLQELHRYRYCIVLLESGQSDDVSLILGCSDVIPLVKNAKIQPTTNYSVKLPKVISIQANLSSFGTLSIDIKVYPQTKCELNIAILEQNALLSQKKLNCSNPTYTFIGLNDSPYRVCANVVKTGPIMDFSKPRCITVFRKEARGFSSLDVAFVTIFLVLCFMVIALVWGVRKIRLKPKLQTHQCFLPPDCENQGQHSKYVKLQATTKL